MMRPKKAMTTSAMRLLGLYCCRPRASASIVSLDGPPLPDAFLRCAAVTAGGGGRSSWKQSINLATWSTMTYDSTATARRILSAFSSLADCTISDCAGPSPLAAGVDGRAAPPPAPAPPTGGATPELMNCSSSSAALVGVPTSPEISRLSSAVSSWSSSMLSPVAFLLFFFSFFFPPAFPPFLPPFLPPLPPGDPTPVPSPSITLET
mmetsp:Transcript_12331/g.39075  ORF Transcript_12331/g.39075 Transcript_12331/m.39075 type:complete len:207 (+) Transcript_12331:892-1512(+)